MWLLCKDVLHAMEKAKTSGLTPTAAQLSEFEAAASDVMAVAGTKAQINVKGVLTASRSWLAFMFGGGNTTYADIQAALAQADADPNVKEITMFVDSPGGQVHGLFECLAAIQATKKPIHVTASRATSAAFAVASVAGPITATSPASFFGSVGVVAGFNVSENVLEITSTNAPKKRPDVTTEEGVAAVREELDALHEIFVDAIATGRGTTVKKVNADFGEGGTLLAGEALKRGMIDAIGSTTATAPTGGNSQEGRSMDLQTLKAQHPDVFAAAVKVGQDQERERVQAHLEMGDASGDMKLAIDSINNGTGFTQAVSAKYLAAGMRRQAINDRQQDSDEASAANGADNTADDGSQDNEARDAQASASILAQAAALCNVELEG